MRNKDRDVLVDKARAAGDGRSRAAIRAALAGKGRDDADAVGFGTQVNPDGSVIVRALYDDDTEAVYKAVAADPARSIPVGSVRVNGETMTAAEYAERLKSGAGP